MRSTRRLAFKGRLAALLALLITAYWSQNATPSEAAAPSPEMPPFRLELPVDCPMGPVCVVQHYVDMSPGPGATDHTCGSLTYDGHPGIDIRTLTRAQMETGVDVVAAAPGTVRLTRDGEADRTVRTEADYQAIAKRYSGNTVEIVHESGWITKYSHLKKGSVSVKPGDHVQAGETVGQIGLSGKTQFPHVEFSLSHKGQYVDPFTGLAPATGCGNFEHSLWSSTAADALAYRRAGLLMSGLSGEIPTYPDLLDKLEGPGISEDPAQLIAWFVAWGLMAGDRITLRLADPAGASLVETTTHQPKTQIEVFRYAGKRRPIAGWPNGVYRARIRIERQDGGETHLIADETHEVNLP